MKKVNLITFSLVLILSLFFVGASVSSQRYALAAGANTSWVELDSPYGFYVGTSKTYLKEAETVTNEATYRFADETLEILLSGKSDCAIIGRAFGYVDFNKIDSFSWHSRGQGSYIIKLISDNFEWKKTYINEDFGEKYYTIDFNRENLSGIKDFSLEIWVLNDSNTQADADQNESTDAGDETQEGEDVYTSVKFSEMFFQGSFEYFSKLFPVTVSVSDVIYGDKLSGATITIDGEKYLSNEQGTVDFEFSKGMHYYTISASGYLLKSGYFEVDQEYNSESVMAIELELQAQYNSNDNKISSWLIVAIIAFLALNVFFTLLYVFRKE